MGEMKRWGWTMVPVLFLGGTVAGHLTTTWADSQAEVEREYIEDVRLTSPYLEAPGLRDVDRELSVARRRIEEYLEDQGSVDPSLQVSVYIRDLADGSWIGIDEDRTFVAASLLKVGVLFYTLARFEADPDLAERTLTYPGPTYMGSVDNTVGRPSAERMVAGTEYRYDELLFRMIRYSDNHAKELLLLGVDARQVDDYLEALGIRTTGGVDQPALSPSEYATLFRILYNSSVFGRPASEYGLGLLLGSVYTDGLRAGVPENIDVASKFGIHNEPAALGGGVQVHECGIVYQPGDPYVLCIMTRGRRSPDSLSPVLAEISRIVYEERLRRPS